MKRKNILFLIALALVLMFIAIPGCSADTESASPSNQEVTLTDDGPNEGIKIHGNWSVEIRNSDGSLEDIHEFENVIINTGKERLAEFLAREASVGAWAIYAGSNVAANNPFFDPDSTTNYFGHIVEEAAGMSPAAWRFPTLTVSTEHGLSLILKGMAIAQRDGSIEDVRTAVAPLASTLPPDSDYGLGSYIFTQKVLTEPIDVLEGQYIVFTVEISFS